MSRRAGLLGGLAALLAGLPRRARAEEAVEAVQASCGGAGQGRCGRADAKRGTPRPVRTHAGRPCAANFAMPALHSQLRLWGFLQPDPLSWLNSLAPQPASPSGAGRR